jgi:DNA polymerase-1
LLAAFNGGEDVHKATAAEVFGMPLAEVSGDQRRAAKAINFGFLYGMWWVKFRSYAKTEYGIDFTEEEAKTIRENFFKTYPMLQDWHNDVQEYVSRTGYIRTFDGRLRHLPNVFSEDEGIAKQAMRQAINSPVQSIASDLGLMTLGRMVPYIRKKGYDKWLKVCGFIHDAIVCLVKEEHVAEGAALVKRFMESNPLDKWFGWTPEIPIVADAEIGRTLAETVELKAYMFEGEHNKHKTFSDLVAEVEALEAKKNSEKTSTIQTKRRKIKLKRGPNHAKTKATEKHQGSRNRIHAARPGGKRRIKRIKPSEDRAA